MTDPDQPATTALERKLRYELAKLGMKLEKTPATSWHRKHHGVGYQVTRQNFVVFGCWHREYEAKLNQVCNWLESDFGVEFQAA